MLEKYKIKTKPAATHDELSVAMQAAEVQKVFFRLADLPPSFRNLVKEELGDSYDVLPSGMKGIQEIANIDKAKCLQALCKHLDVSGSNVVAFGDDSNDVSMLQWVGVGVCMGNSTCDALRKPKADGGAMDVIASPVQQQGVAKLLEEILKFATGRPDTGRPDSPKKQEDIFKAADQKDAEKKQKAAEDKKARGAKAEEEKRRMSERLQVRGSPGTDAKKQGTASLKGDTKAQEDSLKSNPMSGRTEAYLSSPSLETSPASSRSASPKNTTSKASKSPSPPTASKSSPSNPTGHGSFNATRTYATPAKTTEP